VAWNKRDLNSSLNSLNYILNIKNNSFHDIDLLFISSYSIFNKTRYGISKLFGEELVKSHGGKFIRSPLIKDNLDTYEQTLELLNFLPGYEGGLMILSLGLFHEIEIIRKKTVHIIMKLNKFNLGMKVFNQLNPFFQLGFTRLYQKYFQEIDLNNINNTILMKEKIIKIDHDLDYDIKDISTKRFSELSDYQNIIHPLSKDLQDELWMTDSEESD
jgi:hypothetical protein